MGALGCAKRGKISGGGVRGGGSFLLYGGYARSVGEQRPAAVEHIAAVGIRTRGLVGERLGWCAGFDTEIGASDGGFVYDLTVFPAGVGVRAGGASLSVCAGLGTSGVQPEAPIAFRTPVEASLELDLGARVRPLLWVRGAWLLGADPRQSGARTTDVVDELSAGAGIRIGKQIRRSRFHGGNGYYVGVSYREMMGTRFAGAVLGYGVSGGR